MPSSVKDSGISLLGLYTPRTADHVTADASMMNKSLEKSAKVLASQRSSTYHCKPGTNVVSAIIPLLHAKDDSCEDYEESDKGKCEEDGHEADSELSRTRIASQYGAHPRE